MFFQLFKMFFRINYKMEKTLIRLIKLFYQKAFLLTLILHNSNLTILIRNYNVIITKWIKKLNTTLNN